MVLSVLGAVLQDLGRLEQAVKSYDKALRINPDYADAYFNRGIALQKLGQPGAAIKSYDKAIRLEPDFADAYSNRGTALQDLGRLEQAVQSFEKAIQFKPDYAEAYYNRGIALHDLGHPEQAMNSYGKAIQFKPDYANAHCNRGNALHALGQLKAAITSYNKAIQIMPDYAIAYCNRGDALRDLGQMAEAVHSYDRAIQIKPDFAKAHYNLSMLKEYRPDDAQTGLMESLYTDSEPGGSDRIFLCHALARIYEDLGEYEKSFDYLEQGNRLHSIELDYNLDHDRRLFTTVRRIFSAAGEALERAPDGTASIQPLFIVGLPRSGTSLVEQILASHSMVHGAGELATMTNFVNPILSTLADQNISQVKHRLSRNEIKSVHDGYLEELNVLKVPEKIITDKMPLNFRWIGFILSAFPEAKIIHLNRDPRATCWSIYKHYFSKGNGYACDLVDLAEFYGLYTDLMSFWRERFPNTIYDLCYEDLTEDQETVTRKLLAYCDLQWEKQCLDFHQTKRIVQSLSAAEVRKKMYTGSSEAWRKYEAHLQPLIKGLASRS